jgi:hypothetical protein
MFITEPILNFPIRATIMKAIDDLKHIEKRDDYAYLFDNEFFLGIGRFISIGIFYLEYSFLPVNIALSIYLFMVAFIQFLLLPLSRKINGC